VRITAVVASTVALHVLIVLVVRGVALWPITVLGAIASALLLGAVGEWLVHRFLMHRSWKPRLLRAIYDLHQRGHHCVHFTPARYVHRGPINYVPVWPPQPNVLCDSNASRWLSMSAQFVFYGTVTVLAALVPTALLARDAVFMLPFTGTFALEVYLFVRLHDAVHYPGATMLDGLPFFGRLDRHHYIHHIDSRASTNFLLPLGDWLFGTLRRETTAAEKARFPSYEQAREHLIVEDDLSAYSARHARGAAGTSV
jgi:hypothetical protein